MAEHTLQHSEHPTWCTACGKFTPWTEGTDCEGQPGRFDASRPEVWERMQREIFGAQSAEEDCRA